MKIEHLLWQKAPYEEKDLAEVGIAIWKINKRHHGDEEDNFVMVNGYFCYSSSTDGFVFVELGFGPNTRHKVDTYRVEAYGIIID